MIAIVAAATNVAVTKPAAAAANPEGLPFNWYDIVVVALLLFGFYRGRRNGMSKEFLPLLQWLAIVAVCGFFYLKAGEFFLNNLHWSKLTSYICGYLTLAFVITLIFGILRKLFTERMVKNDSFRGGEYYLGMLAAPVRIACILIALMALLNAPVYTQKDIEAHEAYVHQTYGGGQPGFSGDYFPTLQQIQAQVLTKSFIGPVVTNKLGMLLIAGTEVESADAKQPAKPKAVIQIGNQVTSPAPATNPTATPPKK